MDTSPITFRVNSTRLRRMFGDERFLERVQAGELRQEVLRERHPSAPRAGEPFCTRSMIIAYFDEKDHKLALVHQYLRPNGTLGGGGRPDPKLLVVKGVRYWTE